MITFKQYLQEARYRTDISEERAIDLLKANCSDALKHIDTPLIRASKRSSEQAYIMHGELGERQSAWSRSNFYTITLDEVNGPQGYPLRSKSVIFGNWANWESMDHYAKAGGMYALFPYDGVKIGVTPKWDLWEGPAFKIGHGTRRRQLNGWNNFFRALHLDDSSYEAFVSSIETAIKNEDEWADEHEIKDEDKDELDELVEMFDNGKVDEQLHRAYDAKNQDFDLVDTHLIYDISGTHECWTSGKCIAWRLGNSRDDAESSLANLKEMLK